MTVENRRRAERQSAVWIGLCHVQGDSLDLWRDCGVFDLSALGVGMDLRHSDASDLVGRIVSVRLPIGVSMDMTLTGEVKNAKGGPDGIVRIGVEFEDVSDTERSIVDLLERDSLRWRRPDSPS
jgi:PilZ domain-containing protein